MKTRTTERLLWLLFGTTTLLIVVGAVLGIKNTAFWFIASYLPLLILIGHACLTLTPRRGLCFIAGAALTGFAAEAISLHGLILFGGAYTYRVSPVVFDVPVAIITYWAIFIYMGYWLVNSFQVWRGIRRPAKGSTRLSTLIPLILFDGLVVTAIDLLMDPVATRLGKWTWTTGGSYFGVPIGNFVGWFCVAILVTGTFRLYEYYRPQPTPKWDKSIILLPVLGYLLVSIAFLADGLRLHMWTLSFVGAALVITPAAASLIWYCKFRHLNGKSVPY